MFRRWFITLIREAVRAEFAARDAQAPILTQKHIAQRARRRREREERARLENPDMLEVKSLSPEHVDDAKSYLTTTT